MAAPHVSPFGGSKSYAAAYRRLSPAIADRTIVILGTSHYGEPDRFGLTGKPFVTPLGRAEVDVEAVDNLRARGGDAVLLDDYCHAVEHSIEFQVVFLQHVLGRSVQILPILCGAFLQSLREGVAPEIHPGVARFFDALRALPTKAEIAVPVNEQLVVELYSR